MVAVTVVVFGGTLGLLAVLFRAQVRGYDRTVATELLDDWSARLELLDPAERADVIPPSNGVAAMVSLPSRLI